MKIVRISVAIAVAFLLSYSNNGYSIHCIQLGLDSASTFVIKICNHIMCMCVGDCNLAAGGLSSTHQVMSNVNIIKVTLAVSDCMKAGCIKTLHR